MVWKRLPEEDLAAFRAYLDGLPAGGRPRYGLLGVKASWWSRLGGGARPFVVLLAGGRLALTQRSFFRRGERYRKQYPLADLSGVKVRRGLLLESVRLAFGDGYRLWLGGLPRHQSRPLERYLAGEAEALEPSGLTAGQLTNFCQAMQAVGLWPPPSRHPAPVSAGDPGPGES